MIEKIKKVISRLFFKSKKGSRKCSICVYHTVNYDKIPCCDCNSRHCHFDKNNQRSVYHVKQNHRAFYSVFGGR